jgi:phosphoglycolate phosphatase
MPYRAVMFDLDGTLLDTLDDLADAMNFALRQMGCPPHEVAAYKYFVGDGVVNLAWRTLPPDRHDEQTVAQVVALMRERYSEHWADKTRPYEGVEDLLGELATRSLPMAVLSNKPDDFTRQMVAKFFPEVPFKFVLGVRPNGPIKPDPKGALETADALDVSPDEFLYLGDTNTDMQTANAAGMFAVGALWGFRPAEELLQHGAKSLIASPMDLLQHLD